MHSHTTRVAAGGVGMHSVDCEHESMRLNHAHIHGMLWMPTLNPHSMSSTGSQAGVIPWELEIVYHLQI